MHSDLPPSLPFLHLKKVLMAYNIWTKHKDRGVVYWMDEMACSRQWMKYGEEPGQCHEKECPHYYPHYRQTGCVTPNAVCPSCEPVIRDSNIFKRVFEFIKKDEMKL